MNSLRPSGVELSKADPRRLIREILLGTGLIATACEGTERKAPNRVDVPETVVPSVRDAQEKAEARGLKRRPKGRKNRRRKSVLDDLPEPPGPLPKKESAKKKIRRGHRYQDLPAPSELTGH